MVHQQFTRVFDILQAYASFKKEDLFNLKRDGEWKKYSVDETLETIQTLALGLVELKIKPGEKVAIISGNRPAWNFVDFAVQMIGGVTVPMYPTITIEDYDYIFKDAEVKFVFCENEELYLKVKEASKDNKKIKGIYTFDPVADVERWTAVKDLGEGKDPAKL
jgi:long-chain acyl-CoA synthetase